VSDDRPKFTVLLIYYYIIYTIINDYNNLANRFGILKPTKGSFPPFPGSPHMSHIGTKLVVDMIDVTGAYVVQQRRGYKMAEAKFNDPVFVRDDDTTTIKASVVEWGGDMGDRMSVLFKGSNESVLVNVEDWETLKRCVDREIERRS
jgi:hypothetical protein